MDLLGVAYIDVRAKLTNFNTGLQSKVKSELAGTESAFVTGGRNVNRAAESMTTGLRGRLKGFAEKSGLNEMQREVGRTTSLIGVSLGKALPIAALVATAEFTKMAGAFQSQMQLLVSAAGESQAAIAGMGKATLQVARETGTGTTQLTEGLYNLEKAGYRGADATNLLRVAAEGARAEGANLGTVVSGLTSVMASYHVPASQATNAMNALVAAAGESKTSMENFSGALSTVIPIASAAHIRFAEVAGGIATLTQHGTSAAEATQELSSLIRSLQSPSQVASNAMQQLGINVTKFQQGLSNPSIGLIGSINTLTSAITAHMGPAGLVLVNSMKQSQSAGADLQTMLAQMPPKLRATAQEFLNGTTSLTDFRKQFRGMGAEGAAQGQQFLALAQKSKGFNDLLKSGSPAAQTYVQALKSVSGGAIGLNTVLQLTGENFSGFVERTRRVSSAARQGGRDIATWGSVQKSFNVIMAQLGETVKTGAISVGTFFLPYVANAAKATANWFQHLGDGGSVFANLQQKFGPLAGAVGFLRDAFTVTSGIIRNTAIPVMRNLWIALEPVRQAVVTLYDAAVRLGNDGLHLIAEVYTNALGPALIAASKYLADHAQAIFHVVTEFGQFAILLAGIGLAIRLYARALVGAGVVTGAFASAVAGMSLAFTALKTGEIVTFVSLYTDSVIAATIATGAQAVVTGTVAVATGVWTAAQLLLDAVLGAGTLSAFVFGTAELIRSIPVISALTRLWTLAQLQLDLALDANPVGVIILAIAALAIAIVTITSHAHNLAATFHDVFSVIGGIVHDVGDALHALVGIVIGLFTLDGSKLVHSFENLGKAILDLPLHAVQGVGNAIDDLFGIPRTGEFHFKIDTADAIKDMSVAQDLASQMGKSVVYSIDKINTSLKTASFADFDTQVKSSIDTIQGLVHPMDDLLSVTDKNTISFNGVTFPVKQFNAALKESNGDTTKAAALILSARDNADKYHNEINLLTVDQRRFDNALGDTGKNLKLSADDVQRYGSFMGITADQVARGAVSQQRFQDLVGEARTALSTTTGPLNDLVTALFTYQNSAQTATDKTSLFKAALRDLAGTPQDVNVAIAQASQSVNNLVSSVTGAIDPSKNAAAQIGDLSRSSLNMSTSASTLVTGVSQLKDQLTGAAGAMFAQRQHTEGATHAAQDATLQYQKLANEAISNLASKLHLSAGQVAALHTQLDLTPGDKKILFELPGLSNGTTSMETLLNQLNALPVTKTVTVVVNQDTHIKSLGQLGISANGNIYRSIRAFGGGGFENHVAQIAPAAAMMRVWAEPETGGEGYIPLSPSKRPRSAAILAAIARMFGGTFVPGLRIAGFADGGVQRFATGGLTAAQSQAITRASTIISIDRSSVQRLVTAVDGTVTQILNAGRALGTALARQALRGIGSSAYVQVVDRETQQLADLARKRDSVANQLKAANTKLANIVQQFHDASNQVQGSVASVFDIATAGSYNGFATPTSILSALTRQAGQAVSFAANLKSLVAHGLNSTLVDQLANAGVSTSGASVAALSNATPAQIKQINAMYAQVQGAARSAGDTTANAMYRSGISAAQGLVKGLNSQLGAIKKAMTGIADALVNQIKRDLGIHSPSTVGHGIGQNFSVGVAMGVIQGMGRVDASVSTLASRLQMTPSGSTGSGAGGTSVHVAMTVQPSPGMDELALASRTAARLARQIQYGAPMSPTTAGAARSGR